MSIFSSKRNDPNNAEAVSHLSPYLHFGQLAPQRAALEAAKLRSKYKARPFASSASGVRPSFSVTHPQRKCLEAAKMCFCSRCVLCFDNNKTPGCAKVFYACSLGYVLQMHDLCAPSALCGT